MKKLLVLLLALILAVSIMPGCGKKISSDGAVTIKWVMPGPGEQADSQKVWAEFNKKLQTYDGFENVTVKFDVIPASDYSQKFLLMQTGGEKMDIIQTYTLNYADESRNGTFLPLDDYLKNSKDIKADLPAWLLEYGKVDGKTYIIPNYQIFASKLPSIRTSEELIEKYWNQKEAEEFLQARETMDQECFDYIEKYLKKLKDNGKINLGFYLGGIHYKGYEVFLNPYAIKRNIEGDKPEVVNIYLTEEAKAFYRTMASWYKKGYIRKDSLSAKSTEDRGTMGGLSVWFGEKHKDAYEATQFAYPVGNIEVDKNYYKSNTSAAGGTAIYSKSKNPDTAMKIIELMNTKKGAELYNILCYGIEGVHYEKVNENRIKTFYDKQQPTSSEAYGLWTWVVGNTENAWLTQYDEDDTKKMIFEDINNGAETIASNLAGFYPDNTKYKTNLDQLRAIINEYKGQLASGALDDWEKTYNEFLEKMRKCGEEDIRKSLQEQVNEFYKNK